MGITFFKCRSGAGFGSEDDVLWPELAVDDLKAGFRLIKDFFDVPGDKKTIFQM